MQANTDLHPDEVPWFTGSGDVWAVFSVKTLPGFHIKKAGVYRSSLKHGWNVIPQLVGGLEHVLFSISYMG